jgi:hypothetical protein
MNNYWFDYVKSCYDLVVETEGLTDLVLEHEVEAYVVHLMANNFKNNIIGNTAIAISMMTAMQSGKRADFLTVGDECLLIHSYPLKQRRWPTLTYYHDMGTTAYGMANHIMEEHFEPAGKVLNAIFRRTSFGIDGKIESPII